ncbi:MAG: hypothetical protein ACK8QZ_00095 [Anaerolineales bacterium]
MPATPRSLLSWLLPLLLFLILSHTPADPDMWWHLRNGQEMAQQRAILLEDRFSYTRYGAPWVNVFWLPDLILYGLYRVAGFFGLGLVTAALGAALFTHIWKTRPRAPFLSAFLVILAAIAIAPFWSVRPQLASFLLLAWLAERIETWRRSPSRPFWLPLLFLLWANLHGGFIWGFLYLLAFLFGEFLERRLQPETSLPPRSLLELSFWAFLSIPTTLVNPNGLALWQLPFHTVDVSMGIYEWLSPDFHKPFLHPVLWMLFLYLLGLSLRRAPVRLSQTLPILGFAYMGFVSQRALAAFLLLLAPSLLEIWEEIGKAWRSSRPELPANLGLLPRPWLIALNATLVIGLGLGALVRAWALASPEAVHRDYPHGAIAWLRQNRPPGRLFNSYNWGGYLTFNLPEYPVFIDGRADLYGEELIHQWQQIVQATPQAWELLQKWQVQIVLLEPDQPLVKALIERGWKIAYQDQTSILLLPEQSHAHLPLHPSH